MTFLLTGSNGFIGSHIEKKLTQSGENVKAIKFFDASKTLQENFQNLAEQLDVIKGLNVKGLIHCAWLDVRDVNSDRHFGINLPLSEELIRLAKKYTDTFHIMGTCLEYGNGDGPFRETDPLTPSVPYSKAKVRFYNSIISDYQQEIKLNWYRLFYLYGEGQSEETLFGSLRKKIQLKEDRFAIKEPNKIIDYLNIVDAIEMITGFVVKATVTGPINISSGKAKSLEEHVNTWKKEIGAEFSHSIKLEVDEIPDNVRRYEPSVIIGNNEKRKALS